MDSNDFKSYKKYRKFFTSAGKLVVCGKNAEQNEGIIAQAGKNEIVLHTAAAGSPFCNIKSEVKKGRSKEKAKKKDINEAATFCAAYSRDWKKNKKDIEVHVFKGRDIYKDKEMKTGTFGVKRFKSILLKKEDIEKFERKTGDSDKK